MKQACGRVDMIRRSLLPAIVLGAALVQGCATPSLGTHMAASLDPATPRAGAPSLQHAINLRNVAGGSETNPLWMSKVSNSEFRTALEASLKSAELLRSGSAPSPYQLDATLLSLEQPLVGVDITVTCSVRYDLSEETTGKRVFGKTITTPFTAGMKDAFLGVERLRVANEGAVRLNLRQLLTELTALDVGKTTTAR